MSLYTPEGRNGVKVMNISKSEHMVAELIDYSFKMCGCKEEELGKAVIWSGGVTCSEPLLLQFECTYSLDLLLTKIFISCFPIAHLSKSVGSEFKWTEPSWLLRVTYQYLRNLMDI